MFLRSIIFVTKILWCFFFNVRYFLLFIHRRKNQSVDASVRGTEEQLNNVSLSEEALAMLYCMAIMR